MLSLPWISLTLRRAAWAPLLVFGLHVVAARVLGLYRLWPPTDIPMHFLGGLAIAYFFAHAYRAAEELDLLGRPAPVLRGVMVFALVCSTTVFWEFAEFLSDRFLGTHLQQGLEDTLGDMQVGILGGLAFLAGRRFFTGRGDRDSEVTIISDVLPERRTPCLIFRRLAVKFQRLAEFYGGP